MSQDWVANLYTTATVVDTTMSNAELMFATLKSSFAGSSTPSNAAAGQVWYDSNASYKCLQVRDSANAAWRGVMVGSSSCKVWLYLNAVEEGWTIDSSVTDRVLSLKGGSTYVTGADDTQGTWTLSGLTKDAHTHTGPSHNHQWYINKTSNNAIDQSYNSGGTATNLIQGGAASSKNNGIEHIRLHEDTGKAIDNYYTSNAGTGATGPQSDAGITSDATWRISAAVGIMAAPTARG